MPARASARTSCAAVTPEPQYAPTGPAARAVKRAVSSAVVRKVPSGFTLSAAGALTAPGMWPATGSMGSRSPRYRSPARASSSSPVRATDSAPAASSTGMWPGRAVKSPGFPACSAGFPARSAWLSGRPAASQA